MKERYDPARNLPLHLSRKMGEDNWRKDKRPTFWRYGHEIKEVKLGLGNLHNDNEFELEWRKCNSDEDDDYNPPPGTTNEGYFMDVVEKPRGKGKQI